ncbi:PadR family transcriptional regulator [Komagataeibacter oboediens]|uniref:PadR family transcriptional regulator n=1 Tax=Komagataeibacter oboediens TaxID=65958 RepID=UPI001C2DE5FE|nr:PadR family transcriptional regulator [Komagataeibacter oboediens]MBV1822772.1 PadR family transcriptional regulator [Komagataeibacter oboediens]
MKHRNRHAGGRNRQTFSPEGMASGGEPRRHHGRGGHHGGGRRGGRHRLFDYGEMRLLVLSLIAEKPTYGYELIRMIEEKFGGSYAPSPGVIYPTLTWLDEAGYARIVEADGRKNYHITPEGEAFLAASRAALEEILARAATGAAEGRGGRKDVPMPVMRGMENLRTALRLRLRNGGLDTEAEEKIAALLDDAARAIGQV